MPLAKQILIYTFDELSADAQQNALEKLWNINVDDSFWFEGIFEDAKTCAELLGIEIENIYFSGFSNQGDGAQFVGSYSYKPKSRQLIRSHAPNETELHRIADELTKYQRPHFYAVSATVKHSGHYHHEQDTSINVSDDRENSYYNEPDDADALRTRYTKHDGSRDVSEWFEIQHRPNPDNPEELEAVAVSPSGKTEIPLNEVMRI